MNSERSSTEETERTIETLQEKMAAYQPCHAFLRKAQSGGLAIDDMKQMIENEAYGYPSELAGVSMLAARFPYPPAAPYFLSVAALLCDGHTAMLAAAEATGAETAPTTWPARPAVHHISGLLSWIGSRASISAAAAFLFADLAVYEADCRALLPHLRAAGSAVPPAYLSYIEGFASLPRHITDEALNVARYGLEHGEDPSGVTDAPEIAVSYITEFWQTAL